jgi:hypothetical protein
VTSLVVGGVSAALAIHENRYAESHCPTRSDCDPQVHLAQGRRDLENNLAWVTIPVGVAALGGATTWWLLTRHSSEPNDSSQSNMSFGSFTDGHAALCWMRGAF